MFDIITRGLPGSAMPSFKVLAEDFAAGGHDLKRLLRVIVLGRAYQSSAAAAVAPAAGGDAAAQRQAAEFARFPTRPLSVDELYRSIVAATGHQAEDDDHQRFDQGDQALDGRIDFFVVKVGNLV